MAEVVVGLWLRVHEIGEVDDAAGAEIVMPGGDAGINHRDADA
jgi:hypothetical protein